MPKYVDENQFKKFQTTLSAGALQIYSYFSEFLPDTNKQVGNVLPSDTYTISIEIGSIKDVYEGETESFFTKTTKCLNELKEKSIIKSYSVNYYNRGSGNEAEFRLSPL